MRKSLAGLAGIVLLSVCAGCGTKAGVGTPSQKATIYRTKTEEGYSYFNSQKQEANLVDLEHAGKKDDFISFNDDFYKKKEREAEPKEQPEGPQQPEPTEPEYITKEEFQKSQEEFQTMQENYDDRFNALDENYKELRNDIYEIKKILEKSPTYHPQHSSNLVPVQPRN